MSIADVSDMKSFIVTIFLLLELSLYAEQSYIKITKTDDYTKLSEINKTLRKYKLKMKIQKVDNANGSISYIVYSGPYSSYRLGLQDQKALQRDFANPQILTIDKEETKNGFYFGLGVGAGNVNSSNDSSSNQSKISEPENRGFALSAEVGYVFKNNIYTSLGYVSLGSSDIHIDNFYGSLGYRFYGKGDFVPYGSMLLGVGNLTWKNAPVSNLGTVVLNRSTSPFIGGRVGFIYDGFKYISLVGSYQLLMMSHEANIEYPNGDTLSYKHNYLHTFLLEFQHKF